MAAEIGKTAQVAKEMKIYLVSILGINEMRWPNSGESYEVTKLFAVQMLIVTSSLCWQAKTKSQMDPVEANTKTFELSKT
uniref:Uncharacterized protein n=1 Tax=Arion vulgaris TaxID=1028688 RepID=A0A0B6Z9W9_9EUPU